MRLIFILIVFFVSVLPAVGQQKSFKVLANKGDNTVKHNEDWGKVKVGMTIAPEDVLKVASGGYLGLVFSGGKTLELKKQGTYAVKDLMGKVEGEAEGVSGKYADYILNKMSAEEKKNRLSVTGAVSRGLVSKIKVYIPSSAMAYNDQQIITWTEIEGVDAYHVVIKNLFDDTLLDENHQGNNMTLDFSSAAYKNENVLLFEVSDKTGDKKSQVYAVKRMSVEERAIVEKELKLILPQLKSGTALDDYILAGFFESHNLLLDALTMYNYVMQKEPEVEAYREAYYHFLDRNNLMDH